MIIGRKPEQKELLDAANSEYSKFVAVYGRRRVGKTFLIRETFNGTLPNFRGKAKRMSNKTEMITVI